MHAMCSILERCIPVCKKLQADSRDFLALFGPSSPLIADALYHNENIPSWTIGGLLTFVEMLSGE